MGGCVLFGLAGAMGQSFEYQKLIEVYAKYDGIENKKVAVLIEADLTVLFEHPALVPAVTSGVSARIARDVPGAQVVRPDRIIAWQYSTPQWAALPMGDVAEQLGVDRIIYINIYEYRLHPPGNSWLWEGKAAAEVHVYEADSFDPDAFVESFDVQSEFPGITGLGRESATEQQIEQGVLGQFIRNLAWLFHFHQEPKYPDKYQPAVDR
jgi:hypothetical protein